MEPAYESPQKSESFHLLIESLGGGGVLFDYNNDVDLFLTDSGTLNGLPIRIEGLPCALSRSNVDFEFEGFTQQIGLSDSNFHTHGSFAAESQYLA
jgi:hypothetical protein